MAGDSDAQSSLGAKRLLKGALWTGAFLLVRELAARAREQELLGQAAIVTGGSRGLGFLVARELSRHGCRVAICARDRDELSRAVDELARDGFAAFPVECDVSDEASVQGMVAQVTERFGRVDLLVNNAGVIEVGPVASMERADFEQALNVIYWGTLNTILAVLPQMRERRSGKIVNIASIGGKAAVPHLLPYVGAKFAVVGLSEGLSAELKQDGITVTTVDPGLLRTGSYLHAEFKGDQNREAAWFTLSDNIPGLAMSPETAAAQIVRAVRRGKGEVVLSLPAKLLSMANGIFPGVVAEVSSLINRYALPQPRGADSSKMTGEQVRQTMRAEHAPLEPVMELGNKQAAEYLQESPASMPHQNGSG